MSIPRLVIPGIGLTKRELRLDEDAARHAQVLRLKPGARIAICNGNGIQAEAKILSLSSKSLHLRIEGFCEKTSPDREPLSLTLIQSLPKGERMNVIVQKATELGVQTLVITQSQYTIPKPEKKAQDHKLTRWKKIANEAARQCGRLSTPTIFGFLPFAETLPRFLAHDGFSFFCSEAHHIRLRDLLDKPPPKAVTIVVGPEGGFSKEETCLAAEIGYIPVWLGERILRTETAAISACAILQHIYGDLG